MGANKEFIVSAETRKRCKIFDVTDDTSSSFLPISLEQFHFFYEMKHIDFSLYFRFGSTIVEFIRPEEFSHELLNQLYEATQKEHENLQVCVRSAEAQRYQNAVDIIRQRKLLALKEKTDDLDQRTVDIFDHLTYASRMVLRGGISQEVAQRVKASAAYLVANQLDNDASIDTLSRMIICDPTLYDHSASVAMIAVAIASNLPQQTRLTPKQTEMVAQCALYHDAGKSCVPSHILNKPGRFTDEEFAIMKTHTQAGYEELLKAIQRGAQIDPLAARVALEHHEKFNGKGYPHGRAGRVEEDSQNGIHLFTRVVTIADVYSALLMKRVYKPAYESQDAIKIMASCAADYDPNIFVPFLRAVVRSLNASQIRKRDRGRILFFDEKGTLKEKKPNGEEAAVQPSNKAVGY